MDINHWGQLQLTKQIKVQVQMLTWCCLLLTTLALFLLLCITYIVDCLWVAIVVLGVMML